MYGYHFQYDSLTATIPNNPQKVVDKTIANTEDTITYTITQNISKALDKNFYYTSLVFKDVLNSNLSYISLNVYDENNRNVTATAGVTTFESSSRTLKYTFSSDYLKNMNYKGQAYKFIIKAKINTNITTGTITNTSSTIINNSSNYTLTSNVVSTKINYKVIVHHMNQEGKKLADSETIMGYENDKYTTKAKSFYGYELIATPQNSKGQMKEKTTVVIYRYKLKETNVNVKYVDEKGKEIADTQNIIGKVFEQYTTSTKDIYGYQLIETPQNSKGTMTEDSITVIYRYKLKDTNVTIRHVNEEEKEIADTETIKGKVFDEYITLAKNIYGYKLIETPKNFKGTMTENVINVIYRYGLKETNVNVKYINEEGKEITDSINIKGKVFKPYTTFEKCIYGYQLIEIPKNAKGTMTEDTITVTYHYKLKDTKVNVKYIDEEGKEIATADTIKGKVFDQYTTSEKNINGYKLIEIPQDAKGTMSENIITVTYHYRKLEFNIAVSQKLTKIMLNNQPKHISKKLEIDRNTNVNSFKIVYTITVSNPSELEGNTVLYNDIPNGYIALEQDNLGWIINDNIAYRNVENLSIGETRKFTITLTAKSSEVIGTVVNRVYCMDSTCTPKFKETTLVDNVDTKDLIISISTGLTEHITEIFFIILSILVIIAIMLVIARKNIKV